MYQMNYSEFFIFDESYFGQGKLQVRRKDKDLVPPLIYLLLTFSLCLYLHDKKIEVQVCIFLLEVSLYLCDSPSSLPSFSISSFFTGSILLPFLPGSMLLLPCPLFFFHRTSLLKIGE